MNKRDLFVAAMKAGCGQKLAWMVSAFSLTRGNPDAYKRNPYPYRLVNDPLGMHYCHPTTGELVKVDDSVPGEALYRFRDLINLEPGDAPHLSQAKESTYGDFFVNWCVINFAFGTKVPYMDGPIEPNKISKMVLANLQDGVPGPDEERRVDTFYVDELLRFTKALFYLTGFSQLCVWAGTKKTMLPPPGVIEYRNKLLKENEGHLHEMATIAKIDKALVEYDAQWLKDDPGGKYFLSDFKSRNIVRKKLFLMHGAEMSLDDNTVKAKLITNSLSEGQDITKFPDFNNSLRAGAFNRGAETVLGGVSVKWLFRASSNLNITADDCGSRLGNVTDVTPADLEHMVGFSVVTDEGSERIKDLAQAGTYLGKRIMMRSPMYCCLSHTDYCKVCVGERLSVNPTALSIAVTSYGDAFLYIFMSGSHSKAMTLAKMDLKSAIT